jgi:hypothetical protein
MLELGATQWYVYIRRDGWVMEGKDWDFKRSNMNCDSVNTGEPAAN